MCPHALLSLDALDLPRPRSRPPFSLLKDTLVALTLRPSDFTSSHNAPINVSASTAGVANYLTTLISSPFPHLTEEEREEIWTLASVRLSERAGRSGMGALTRTFSVPRPYLPLHGLEDGPERSRREAKSGRTRLTSEGREGEGRKSNHNGGEDLTDKGREKQMQDKDEDDMLHITIHEPAFTGDNLGLKTWGAAYVLATLLSGPILPLLLPLAHSIHQSAPADQPESKVKIIELGAGTGLAGIAAAAMFPSRVQVTMTDLEPIVPNLRHNVGLNESVLSPNGNDVDVGEEVGVTVEVLDWTTVPNAPNPSASALAFASDEDRGGVTEAAHKSPILDDGARRGGFDIILAADSLYATSHPGLVSNAIAFFLKRNEDARVVSVMPDRGKGGGREFLDQLREEMQVRGLGVVGEGWEVGGEDWDGHGCADGGDESGEGEGEDRESGVRFWWAVWRWM